jgi:phospholipid/cholesterol/gamma-HCH transport system permease protein
MLLTTDQSGDTLTLRLTGDWSIDRIADIERELAAIGGRHCAQVRVDCTALKRLDLSAAWLLRNCLNAFAAQGATVQFDGARPVNLEFVEATATGIKHVAPEKIAPEEPITAAMAALGKASIEQAERSRSALEFYGRVLATAAAAFAHPKRLRGASIARHVYETGVQAAPIVALIGFLITLVIAYIGAQQLVRFGAEIFTVDLVTVGVLREMGVLLTAIIVAGRSGRRLRRN